ncbi:Eco57I restriction-modification methylase domain-containing protein [Curtobacterium flaccumfaciens]|nr:Eco57I restriction-modification methylase domain-containing protein [Curtobacterium flaccumfaciens]
MLRDFLSRPALPVHDFMIVNPPYARADEKVGYETARCRDLYAYFMERVAKTSHGYIAVTPASYLSAPKFQPLRDVIDRESGGGDIYVFDNVPDTLFRGYKFGSNNTSKTNFVRAAVTVCKPEADEWKVTPIIRWQASARATMFDECGSLLVPRRIGPHGEWAKLGPGLERIWDALLLESTTIKDLVTPEVTKYRLDVGLTPRYYISATHRKLDRGSKATLFFGSKEDRDRAAVVLNSSVPYLWWRALDGGVTLPSRVLMSVPVPPIEDLDPSLIERLHASEEENLVIKINAGRANENVKHPEELVRALNDLVLPGGGDLRLLYANSMFPLAR